MFHAIPSWLTSTMAHGILILVLALLTIPLPRKQVENQLLVLNPTKEVAEDLSEFRVPEPLEPSDDTPVEETTVQEAELVPEDLVSYSSPELTAAPRVMELDPLGLNAMLPSELDSQAGTLQGRALEGRGAASKARWLREAGGTPGSEAAVAGGLRWLAQHQFPDGSWGVDHRLCPTCRAACPDSGKLKGPAPFGATGLALLPFLGAGHTHLEGEYKQVVDRGIKFLLRNMAVEGDRGSLVDPGGNYYSHALCTIVMCECLALSQDRKLQIPAQLLVNESMFAQHPVAGGWRYRPRDPNGDTSMLGWQVMALKSGHLAGLKISPVTVRKASEFLDLVASEEGHKYRYLVRPNLGEAGRSKKFVYRKATTAVGLLCRMYLGWPHDEPRLEQGVRWLSKKGPSIDSESPDVYYDYHATQVMRHYGGELWDQWNLAIRDRLIARQETNGHAAGSWYFGKSEFLRQGGRLYCTALATMILEVYYRHLPLYQGTAVESEFPL